MSTKIVASQTQRAPKVPPTPGPAAEAPPAASVPAWQPSRKTLALRAFARDKAAVAALVVDVLERMDPELPDPEPGIEDLEIV